MNETRERKRESENMSEIYLFNNGTFRTSKICEK